MGRNKFVLVLLLVLIITSLLVTVLVFSDDLLTRKDNKDEGPCISDTNQIITRAKEALDLDNQNRQTDIVSISDEAMKLKNYEQDSYCMQLIAIRYVEQGDYNKSTQSLDILNELIRSKNAKTLGLEVNFTPVENLVLSVASLKSLKDQLENNNPYLVDDPYQEDGRKRE